jgi:acyl-CoA-dependent ceramide synthase
MFGLFVISWFAARHVGYLAVCYSIYAHVNTNTMLYGTYSTLTSARISPNGGDRVLDNLLQPLLNPAATTVAFNAHIRWIFLGLLGGLQLITIGWFIMICRVVARVLQGHPADDSRSDDEDEVEDLSSSPAPTSSSVPFHLDQASSGAERRFIEVPATSEDIRYSSRPANGSAKRKGKGKNGMSSSSGLNLGEHKDFLNRIGCLSDEQLAREKQLREEKDVGRRK